MPQISLVMSGEKGCQIFRDKVGSQIIIIVSKKNNRIKIGNVTHFHHFHPLANQQ